MEDRPRVVILEEHDTLSMLAEEVATTRRSVLLRKEGHDVAVIIPLTKVTVAEPSKDEKGDRQAFIESAGGLKGLVDEELFNEIYRSRTISTRNVNRF